MRPLVAHNAVQVDQSADTVRAGVEDITAVGEVGIVERHTAELNEGHGQ
jgi:hypothetical protein